jgi:hypothetical protein
MPKTLAALPSSQYATALELESGKRDAGLSLLPAGKEVLAAAAVDMFRTP